MTIIPTALPGPFGIEVGPSALPEADGGVALRCHLHDGPVIFAFTRARAREILGAISEELDAGTDGTTIERLRAFYSTAASPLGDE